MANTGLRLLFLLILVACTEKVSIEPVYTGDTDWKPTISLTGNNYQRVGLSFEQPPRLELERNLVRYIFEVQRIGSPNFVPIDTINLIHRFRGFIPSSYVTPAILEQNTDYAIRMVVQYREGIEQRSYEKYFLTPWFEEKSWNAFRGQKNLIMAISLQVLSDLERTICICCMTVV